MDRILCKGKVALQGSVRIQGAKNAALPILAATLLTDGKCYIENCPKISDVYAMLHILESLCCEVKWDTKGVFVDTGKLKACLPCKDSLSNMRSSICLLGALLGRTKEVILDYPGGCVIGARPIDLHLEALGKMGVQFDMKEDHIRAFHEVVQGAKIQLSYPSVGATENVIMTAVKAKGHTILQGAALEPEIVALCDFLNRCGARIQGAGTSVIDIEGVERLKAVDFRIPADRIVAGTYLLAVAGCSGNVFLQEAPASDMAKIVEVAGEIGANLEIAQDGIFVQADGCVKSIPKLQTMPYPGFPTDLQSVLLTIMTVGDHKTLIEETVFENRFRIIEELRKMGADIEKRNDRCVLVSGVEGLHAGSVKAHELRGGAALVVAGLLAEGQSIIRGVEYIERGYENICRDFKELGARITSG